MKFISLMLVMGMTSTVVWVISQRLPAVPVEQMTISKDYVAAGDLIFQPALTTGIILSYSFQPWGGAVSYQPMGRLCPQELGVNNVVRACRGLTGSTESGEIPMKDL